ncbi:MAG: hypothetical protein RE471_03000 [Ferroplasma sp.]|uniref:hypothetical protein n=1 Tax=Ferroplasma sp. TaxID=2591003 RepID=UPI0028152446|nr:hypothetical protein [Ferroplasma sp.]WMT51855.1 MAG: hypothetical protein RE471_03000 [Ferroplasma sp.]
MILIFIAFASLGLTDLFKGIISLLLKFLGVIMSGISGMFVVIFGGLGNSVVIMLQSFGFSTAQYGILGPMVFVAGLGGAFLVGYLFLVPTRAEEDVVQAEDDI